MLSQTFYIFCFLFVLTAKCKIQSSFYPKVAAWYEPSFIKSIGIFYQTEYLLLHADILDEFSTWNPYTFGRAIQPDVVNEAFLAFISDKLKDADPTKVPLIAYPAYDLTNDSAILGNRIFFPLRTGSQSRNVCDSVKMCVIVQDVCDSVR